MPFSLRSHVAHLRRDYDNRRTRRTAVFGIAVGRARVEVHCVAGRQHRLLVADYDPKLDPSKNLVIFADF